MGSLAAMPVCDARLKGLAKSTRTYGERKQPLLQCPCRQNSELPESKVEQQQSEKYTHVSKNKARK
jgi:hypothetical protein